MDDLAPLPDGPFGAIEMDPAWHYKTYDGKKSVPTLGADPYRTLPLPKLKEIPVASIAARDCALFMWIVDSHIPQGIELAEHWGFTFRTKGFTWVKLTKDGRPKMGMGKWTRKETEQCYIFGRGKPPILSHGVRETIFAPVREHSRKPVERYERIERLVGGPYLEMFARNTLPNWSSWGNEVNKYDVR